MEWKFEAALLLIASLPAAAWAEETPPSQTNAPSGVTVSGYLDGYLGYNFNRPSPPSLNLGPSTSGGTLPQYLPASQNGGFRNFDLYHDQFSLGTAEISASKKGKEVGFTLDLDFGEIPDTIHNSGGASAVGTLDEVSKHVGQAYVSYSPSAAPELTIGFGKTYTHMGLETAKSKDNWNYSRSDLYAVGIPYWHLGGSMGYAWVPERFTTTLFLYNGWNCMTDNNPAKTVGLQLAYKPNALLTVIYNGIAGAEGAGNSDFRMVHDLNFTYTLSPRAAFALDAIYGTSDVQGGVNWKALEALGKFTLSPHYYLSPRVEGYWDPQGFTTGTAQSLFELTLTNGFPISEGLEARLEGRLDHSDQSTFGVGAASGPSQNQVTATLGVLYSM